VTVRLWRTDRLGRDVIDVEWYAIKHSSIRQ